MKFCKSCGGQVNSRNYCTSCGKQYFSLRSKWIITSFVLLLLFLASSVFSFLLYQQTETLRSDLSTGSDNQAALSSEISTLTADLQALQQSHDEALAQISSLESDYSILSSKKGQLQSSYDKLSEQLADCEASYRFLFGRSKELRKSVVFYNRGATYYHALIGFCGLVDDNTFEDYLAKMNGYDPDISTLCSPEEAKSQGYLPCPFCMG